MHDSFDYYEFYVKYENLFDIEPLSHLLDHAS